MPEMRNVISPYEEMIAYEALWTVVSSQKQIAEIFNEHDMLPSKAVKRYMFLEDTLAEIRRYVEPKLGTFSVSVRESYQYPRRLSQAKYPVELFYYRGDLGLLECPCISVVGTRAASGNGQKRTRRLVHGLVEAGYAIVSGLARGIDTAAHKAVINSGGRTVAVIGTPIDKFYPPENRRLQEKIAEEHLLISQVPFYCYQEAPLDFKKLFFPQRDVTMAALSKATVIVEASDTSGTLIQARECLRIGRPLFILNSCFLRTNITWPQTYAARGAIRVTTVKDILNNLSS